MLDLQELRELIKKALSEIDFPSSPKGLYEPIKYALEGGGKRLRPLLMLSLIEALGGNPHKYLDQAVGLELYHNSTLLHDDIMDNAPVRHGRPSVFKKWGTSGAILSGDAMMTLSGVFMTRNLNGYRLKNTINLFHETILKVDEGQQLDMNFESRQKVSPEEYEEMTRLKTGALFAAACGLAVILSADPSDGSDYDSLLGSAVKLGYLLGVIFQLQDDMFDSFGSEATFGKAIGGDILNDKKTWLQVRLLESDLEGEALALMNDKDIEPEKKIASMIDLYNRLGLKDEIRHEIRSKLQDLAEVLFEMSDHFVDDGLELMEQYIGTVIRREK